MSKTYQTRGIIVKKKPFKESDAILTVLSPDYGLFQAIAPNARKYNSSLRGRSEIFMVNEMLLTKGRSLDRISQLETINSYPNLSKDLGKLSASQYLGELILNLAVNNEPQLEIYEIFKEHLRRINNLENKEINVGARFPRPFLYSHLSQAVFHILAINGIAPQFQKCCLTNEVITADLLNPQWKIGFSFEAGGILQQAGNFAINMSLNGLELSLMQHLGEQNLVDIETIFPSKLDNLSLELAWVNIERCLRNYAGYHLNYSFKSSILIDNLFPLNS